MPGINPLENIRPGWVKLKDLWGTDMETTLVADHPDFPNPKQSIRRDIIDSVKTAGSPAEISPIDVFLNSDGAVIIADGRHRVTAFLEKYKETGNEIWGQIKCNRLMGNAQTTQLHMARANLAEGRSNLTQTETVDMISRLLNNGYEKGELVAKLGHKNSYLIGQIERISLATPDIMEAIRNNAIDLDTGAKIADKVDVTKQAEAVETAAEIVEKAIDREEGNRRAREELGIRKPRVKLLKYPSVLTLLWEIWEDVVALLDVDKLEKDCTKGEMFTLGQWNALSQVLKIDVARDWKTDVKPEYQELYETYMKTHEKV